VLSEIIAKLHNPDGSVAIPGFYDKVLEITPEEKIKIAGAQEFETDMLGVTGVSKLYGEANFSPLERAGARPTLDVNGLLAKAQKPLSLPMPKLRYPAAWCPIRNQMKSMG
jgi:hypothetical protein